MFEEIDRAQTSKELLVALKKDYENDKVYPSVVDLICEFLDRRHEMQHVFDEVDAKTSGENVVVRGSRSLILVWDIILMTATYEKPAEAKRQRQSRKRFKELNREIVNVASRLQSLLDEGDELRNKSGFYDGASTDARYHFEKAADRIPLYRSWPKEEVESLFHRFDCKYWPSLQDILLNVIEESVDPEIVALSSITDAATKGRQTSNANFIQALDARVRQDINLLPAEFQFSHNAVASIANVALKLSSDELMTAEYVRVSRFRNKQKKSSTE